MSQDPQNAGHPAFSLDSSELSLSSVTVRVVVSGLEACEPILSKFAAGDDAGVEFRGRDRKNLEDSSHHQTPHSQNNISSPAPRDLITWL